MTIAAGFSAAQPPRCRRRPRATPSARRSPLLTIHHGAEVVLVGRWRRLPPDRRGRTARPAGPVWWVTRTVPNMARAVSIASSRPVQTLTPPALAAPAGVDLGLDHPDRAAERIDRGLHPRPAPAPARRAAPARQTPPAPAWPDIRGGSWVPSRRREDRGRALIALPRPPRLSRRQAGSAHDPAVDQWRSPRSRSRAPAAPAR